MRAIAGLLPVVAAAGLAMTAGAQEIFRWTDGNGVVHYSDAQPKGVAGVERMPVTLAPTVALSRLPDPINDAPVDAAADVPVSVSPDVPARVPARVPPPDSWPSTTLTPASAPPPATAKQPRPLTARALTAPASASPAPNPPAPTELSMLELERLCEYATQNALAPVKDAAIAQCKADTRNDPAFCDRFNVYFSDAGRMASGRLQSNVFDDLPECVTAAYERRRRGL